MKQRLPDKWSRPRPPKCHFQSAVPRPDSSIRENSPALSVECESHFQVALNHGFDAGVSVARDATMNLEAICESHFQVALKHGLDTVVSAARDAAINLEATY